jgi:hypothetical protein
MLLPLQRLTRAHGLRQNLRAEKVCLALVGHLLRKTSDKTAGE